MDRKVKKTEIPKRQQWLYDLQEWGMVKAILFIWGIMMATAVIVLAILKWLLSTHR